MDYHAEKERILRNIRIRGHPTKEEAETLNRMNKVKLEKVCEAFEVRMSKIIEIKVTDKPEEVDVKVTFSERLLNWILDFSMNIADRVGKVYSQLEKGIDYCKDAVKKLFDFLWSIFD